MLAPRAFVNGLSRIFAFAAEFERPAREGVVRSSMAASAVENLLVGLCKAYASEVMPQAHILSQHLHQCENLFIKHLRHRERGGLTTAMTIARPSAETAAEEAGVVEEGDARLVSP